MEELAMIKIETIYWGVGVILSCVVYIVVIVTAIFFKKGLNNEIQ